MQTWIGTGLLAATSLVSHPPTRRKPCDRERRLIRPRQFGGPLSHREDRRAQHLLSRGRPRRCADRVAAAWFPSSSSQYRNLIPALADRYHVIAPDYPWFGNSSAPDHRKFAYTFTHLTDVTDVTDALLAQKGVDRYTIYIQGYGGSVGLRLAIRHPKRVTGLIVQNGNAYQDRASGFLEADQGLSDGEYTGSPQRPATDADAGQYEGAISGRGARSPQARSRCLAARSGAARSAGQCRDPARSLS